MNKQYIYILALLALIILLMTFRKPIKKGIENMTRGYRNNNPGNIEKTFKDKAKTIQTLWKGEVKNGNDKRFKTFASMEYGYRAIFVLLREYINKGYDTIEKIISRYAPPKENITEAYISAIENVAEIDRKQKINFGDTELIKNIVFGISEHENGVLPDIEQINNGYNLLLTA